MPSSGHWSESPKNGHKMLYFSQESDWDTGEKKEVTWLVTTKNETNPYFSQKNFRIFQHLILLWNLFLYAPWIHRTFYNYTEPELHSQLHCFYQGSYLVNHPPSCTVVSVPLVVSGFCVIITACVLPTFGFRNICTVKFFDFPSFLILHKIFTFNNICTFQPWQFEMLEYKPLVDESSGEKLDIEGDIEFKNVTFHYPLCKTLALNKLSFNIGKG